MAVTRDGRDLVRFRCTSDECDRSASIHIDWYVPRAELPTPGPCPACGSSMRLCSRLRIASEAERRDASEYEVSG